jgi:3-hydroxybutyryl-CoA dehydrogenase
MSEKLEKLAFANHGKRLKQSGFNNITIIGGGIMGRGLTQLIAGKGLEVIFIEHTEELALLAKEKLSHEMDLEIQRWGLTESEKRGILARVNFTSNIEEVEKADLVIEAIPESLEKKQSLFKKLDEICHESTVFCTNTSSLSITEIANVTRANRQERILGLHFLQPVVSKPIVEIIRALKTSDKTFEDVQKFTSKLSKTAVEVYEYPGYITTRVILPMLNEAMYTLMEGIATADGIDTAMKLGFNMGHGPLTLADEIGLDEVLFWMESLFKELGDLKYRPCPILKKKVRAGHLGKKVGIGFFKYNDNGSKI